MPRVTKSSAQGANHVPPPEELIQSSQEQLSSSNQEPDQEISFQYHRQLQPVPSMLMPYIEGPKMDWTVKNELYHRFFKWCLKCENILEYKLAALPECQKCKKVIAWSGDFGMDQYVSWSLPSEELTLDTIWRKIEEFCKPQWNEVWAHFDLLTSFRQGNQSIDEWYNAVQAQVNLAKYPPENAKIFHRNIFWFSLQDKELVLRTISEESVDLDIFPTSRVHQLAKWRKSSKATVHHIKQVAGDP